MAVDHDVTFAGAAVSAAMLIVQDLVVRVHARILLLVTSINERMPQDLFVLQLQGSYPRFPGVPPAWVCNNKNHPSGV